MALVRDLRYALRILRQSPGYALTCIAVLALSHAAGRVLHYRTMDLADYQPNLDVSRAATLPARWYTDPRFLDLERGKVFGRTWQAVGHAATVEEPGAYFGCEVLGEPLVVARDEEGQLRAFSNVCRHRASLIVTGQGRGSSLRCPYHGWTYSLDGRLLGQPEFEGVEDWDRSGAGLPPARVETWGPYVFINLDPLAPELAEVLGEIPGQVERLGCAAGRLRFSCRREYRLECNWKVYIDNYLEGYHLPVAHPGLFRELDYSQYRVDTFRYHSSQYAPLRPSGDEGEAAGRRYPRENGERKALYFWVFPNFMLNVYPDNLSANIILPEGPDRTLTIFEWFSYGSGEVAPETIAFSDEIQQQDIRLCESVQRGLRSRAYNRGRFSAKRENGVHHFHLLLNEFLAG